MELALVFPGQGSQTVGMGRELAAAFPVARRVFEEVDDAVSQALSRLMFEGSQAELTLTQNAQPAIMAVSLAVALVLREAGVAAATHVKFAAGHSLGEYSALAAAGALSLADAARLLKRRGQSMQRAVPVGEGAMAALLGLQLEQAETVAADAAQDQVCAIANDNSPGQQVVSGHTEAVARAITLAADNGARRSVMLPVSAPFHCALMRPAAIEVTEALEQMTIRAPAVPVIANVTAEPVGDPATIRTLLAEQVVARVRWRESVERMAAAGLDLMIECGPGRVLSGLARRIDKSLECVSAATPAEIESVVTRLQADGAI